MLDREPDRHLIVPRGTYHREALVSPSNNGLFRTETMSLDDGDSVRARIYRDRCRYRMGDDGFDQFVFVVILNPVLAFDGHEGSEIRVGESCLAYALRMNQNGCFRELVEALLSRTVRTPEEFIDVSSFRSSRRVREFSARSCFSNRNASR